MQKEIKKEKNIQTLANNFIEFRDERSFKLLYERVKPGVLNHCYSILKEAELAEDAFLNAMAKVWQKIEQYDNSRGNFSTWCYNIARNESLLSGRHCGDNFCGVRYQSVTTLHRQFRTSMAHGHRKANP